jgi:hypothetical protein
MIELCQHLALEKFIKNVNNYIKSDCNSTTLHCNRLCMALTRQLDLACVQCFIEYCNDVGNRNGIAINPLQVNSNVGNRNVNKT